VHIPTGEKVAIKILEKCRIIDVSDIERVSREIHILKLIRHPTIIQLYEVIHKQIIETPSKLYLIMEYASSGELFDHIVSSSRLKEKEACSFFQQIVAGIEYIHKLNVVHRDLKPENLLLDHNNKLKIVDFGLSNTYKPNEELKTACGSPCYAAPEMIAGKKYAGLKVDIWSSGVILFAMICGYLPFEDPNTGELYKKILACTYKTPKFISEEAKDLLRSILITDPEDRIGIEGIRNHPWFKQVPEEKCPGILIGYDQIPVDNQILVKLEAHKMKIEYIRQCLEANKHNSTTTGYYLLLKKHIQEGGTTKADLQTQSHQVTKGRSLSISIETEPETPLLRLTHDKNFVPIYPKRSESVHNKSSSYSHTPSNEKNASFDLRKNVHQRTNSSVAKQQTRVISASPNRDLTKKIEVKVNKEKSTGTYSTRSNRSANQSFRFISNLAPKPVPKPTKGTRKLFMSK